MPVKLSRGGVAWNGAWTGVSESVQLAGLGGGLRNGLAATGRDGVGGDDDTTLGDSCMGTTLGRPGIGDQSAWRDGGASRRHNSKMSRRLVIASTCEMLVGGCAPVRAPATTWRP